METFPPIVWVLAILALALVVIRILLSRSRRQMLIDFAGVRKWALKPKAKNLDREFGDVAPFNRGTKRTSSNILIFPIGDSSGLSMDYSYQQETGQSRDRERFHVVGVNLPKDIGTLTLAKTDSEWGTQGESAKLRRRVVNPKLTAWLSSPDNLSDNYTISRAVLFTFAPGLQDIDRIDDMVASLRGFAEQIPPSLWQDGTSSGKDD